MKEEEGESTIEARLDVQQVTCGSLAIGLDALRPDFALNLQRPRHRWFLFKEGFDSSVVDYVLQQAGVDVGAMLDPFGGSGTTALQAGIRGWSSTSIEANPFVGFVARTKTLPGSGARLRRGAAEVAYVRPRSIAHRLPRDTTLVERGGLDKWLFNRSIVARYEVLYASISQLCDETTASFLVLALIGAMGDVANAKRDGKCWRYKPTWRLRGYGASDLDSAFRTRVEMMASDLDTIPALGGSARMLQGDSRSALVWHRLREHQHHALLTSPPYLNSFDYTDIYRPEMLLLGSGRNAAELRRIRFRTVRSHVQVDWPNGRKSGFERVGRYVRRLRSRDLWNSKLPEMVNGYFVDLEMVFSKALSALAPGSPVAVVVADSAYDGVVIPVPELIAEILSTHGVCRVSISRMRAMRGNAHHQLRGGRPMRECMILGWSASSK